jgi:hypothetical protein
MNISEVIADLEELKNEHGDLEVLVAKDAEGNGFELLGGYGIGYRIPSDYEIEFSSYPDEWEDFEVNALVLWP